MITRRADGYGAVVIDQRDNGARTSWDIVSDATRRHESRTACRDARESLLQSWRATVRKRVMYSHRRMYGLSAVTPTAEHPGTIY